MNLEELKTQITEILGICKDVPEEFRARCFEILLGAAIQQHRRSDLPDKDKEDKREETDRQEGTTDDDESEKNTASLTELPGNVKAFLRKKALTKDVLEKVIMIEDGELHFIREPNHKNAARGQNEWALLIALKNAVMGGNFTVDPEEVRSTTQDKGFYDKKNFASKFKTEKYAEYYKGKMEPQGAAQGLSQTGETALAELIKALAAQDPA
jgi:hypothetical protein